MGEAAVLWPLALALVAAGGVAGTVAGLLGVGGGIVIVPVLYHTFSALGVDPSVLMHLAVGTSLATIVPTAIVSTLAHRRRGAVDAGLLRAWAPGLVVGVVAGGLLAGPLAGVVLIAVFAVIALAVAAHMAFVSADFRLAPAPPRGPGRHLVAFMVGGFSALMGIGGGTLSVPILTVFGTPIHRAIGTAAAIGIIIAIPGAAAFIHAGIDVPGRPPASLGYVSLVGFALIVPATMLTAPFGARLAHGMPVRGLKRVFAVFLTLTSARMLWDVLS
ncbi:MAG: sulfite exporter TauE/SafE family protein [Alphaproteobacteria bacterium]